VGNANLKRQQVYRSWRAIIKLCKLGKVQALKWKKKKGFGKNTSVNEGFWPESVQRLCLSSRVSICWLVEEHLISNIIRRFDNCQGIFDFSESPRATGGQTSLNRSNPYYRKLNRKDYTGRRVGLNSGCFSIWPFGPYDSIWNHIEGNSIAVGM